jgi:Major Facilitator Superfamily
MRQGAEADGVQRRQACGGKRLYYGWLVAGASFCIVLLNTGVQQSFGNFLKPMSAEFGWDRATVSLPAAMAILMNGLFQPCVGQLVDRFGPRRVITLSLLLLACSMGSHRRDDRDLVSHRDLWGAVRTGFERCRERAAHDAGGPLVRATAGTCHGVCKCWGISRPADRYPRQHGAPPLERLAHDLPHPRRDLAVVKPPPVPTGLAQRST